MNRTYNTENTILLHDRYIAESEPFHVSRTGSLVYNAIDTVNQEPRILKTLADQLLGNPEYVHKMLVEAEVLAELDHIGIPKLTDVFYAEELGNAPVIAMEKVDGQGITRYTGMLGKKNIVHLALGLTSVLEYLSESTEISHGDVWIENILMAGRLMTLFDYGNTNRAPIATIGTIPYVSAPEFCESRQATPESDLYSMAVTLFVAMVSRIPFHIDHNGHGIDSNPSQRVYRALEEREVKKYGLYGHNLTLVNATFEQALDKEPSNRFGRIREFRQQFLVNF